jgi:hypothetical protein
MQTSSFSKYCRTPGRLAWLFDLIERLGNPLPETPILCGWPAFFVGVIGQLRSTISRSSSWLPAAQ